MSKLRLEKRHKAKMKNEKEDGLGSKLPQMETEKKEEGKHSETKKSMVVPESGTDKSESGKAPKSIFKRAIASANKHKIKLKPGRENAGVGNCSYESVIFRRFICNKILC